MLAIEAGVSSPTVGKAERGERKMRLDSLKCVAEALGVDVRELINPDRPHGLKVVLDRGATMPSRAHYIDAGYDLYTPVSGFIPPRGSLVIDTGVHMAIPEGHAGVIISKSGLNVNHGLIADGLIDSGYTGSIKVKLYNLSDEVYVVTEGQKITQLVILPIATPDLVRVDSLDETERGEGGFGSTGK